MNDFDPSQFEAELRSLRPARPSEARLERLARELAHPPTAQLCHSARAIPWRERRIAWYRWLLPAAAAVVFAGLVVGVWPPRRNVTTPVLPAASHPVSLKADQVEIDRRLVANFEAVAHLPDGQPVRFRCERWLDRIQWRDSARGVVLEQTTPRLEIVPVAFETY